MILIVRIEFGDGAIKEYKCVDLPMFQGDFITLFLQNFVREHIRTQSVMHIKTYLK